MRQFYGSPSTYWWDDDEGVTHEVVQGEGGEQGDRDQLLPTERLLAFLDDLYVLCSHRVADVHIVLQQALWEHSRITGRPKSGEGLLKSKGGGLGVQGFRGLGV